MEPGVFLFANLGAYGRVRTVFKIGTVALAVVTLCLIFVFLWTFTEKAVQPKESFAETFKVKVKKYSGYEKRFKVRYERYHDYWQELLNEPYVKPLKLGEWIGKILKLLPAPVWVFISLSTLGLAIVAMELEIKWNRLTGLESVSSSGEIIPLVIGSSSLLNAPFLYMGAREANQGPVSKQVELPEDKRNNKVEGEAGEDGGVRLNEGKGEP